MSHVCGWAIAAQRRARSLYSAKQFWLGDVQSAFHRAKSSGFTGTIQEWMTHENLLALINRRGACPFTRRALIKHGWQLPRPYGRPGRRALWMLVTASGGTLPDNYTAEWYRLGPLPISLPDALKACRRAKITPAHIAEISATIAADPTHYSRTVPDTSSYYPGRTMLEHSLPAYDRPNVTPGTTPAPTA